MPFPDPASFRSEGEEAAQSRPVAHVSAHLPPQASQEGDGGEKSSILVGLKALFTVQQTTMVPTPAPTPPLNPSPNPATPVPIPKTLPMTKHLTSRSSVPPSTRPAATPVVDSHSTSQSRPRSRPASTPPEQDLPPKQSLAVHDRIIAINRVWKEKRQKMQMRGKVSRTELDSDTDSDDSGSDIPCRLPVPKANRSPPARDKVLLGLADGPHKSLGDSLPPQKVTPVPLPGYPKSSSASSPLTGTTQETSPSQRSDRPEAKSSGSRAHPPPSPETHLVGELGETQGETPGVSQDQSVADDDEYSCGDETDEDDGRAVVVVDKRPQDRCELDDSSPVRIACARNGRPYSRFKKKNGETEMSKGCIIPTNYRLRNRPPKYICPVRDCQKLFRNMRALGGHFNSKHCYSTFNDNRDGTLSFASKHAPMQSALSPRSRSVEQFEDGSANASSTPKPAKQGSSPLDMKPVDYLMSLLDVCQTKHRRMDIEEMRQLPMRRELPRQWIDFHGGTTLKLPHFATVVAYIVGDEVTGADACHRRRSRLSNVCVALPDGMSVRAKGFFSRQPTCVGCYYYSCIYRQKNECKWAPPPSSGLSDVDGDDSRKAGRTPAAASDDRAVSRVRRSAAHGEVAGEGTPTADGGVRHGRRKRSLSSADGGPASKVAKISPAFPEQQEREMDMEDWEFAPGFITDASGNGNVAYSGAYLTGSQPITVAPEVGVNVVFIAPGTSSSWHAEPDKLRTCSVTRGKVKLTMGGTQAQVGENGVFVIKPGQSCRVENKRYDVATIHCVAMQNYELAG
ncbi:hypothetical protein RJ55_02016 [Drechmeria coniospora]|nr:hypothetical protein RJ55_02016 [Drechmeria coniospora]